MRGAGRDPRLRAPSWDAAASAPRRRLRLLVLLALPLAAWYFGWLLYPERVGHPVLYGLLVGAELFNLCQAGGFWWTVTRARTPGGPPALGTRPSVDVLIPVYDEPVEVVEPTVRAARALRGARVRVHVLDDGRRDEVRDLARRARAGYIRRPDRSGAKAGNINFALARTDAEFVVVLDCDHVPSPRFLERTLGHLRDRSVAFVQTPQYYGNSQGGGVAAAAWAQQALFFGAIARGKDGHGAMFCCGTNFVFRRAALEAVDGFPTGSVTEDFELSIKLHERGWEARYVPEVLAVGLGPEDMSSYVSQQQRWARGCIGAIASALRARLPLRVRLQYLLSSMYFLSGWTLLVYMSFPVVRILTGEQPLDAASADQFLAHFAPYFGVALATVAVAGAGAYSFAGFSLAAASFWIHVQAALRALARRRARFVVTPKRGAAQRQPRAVAPALLAIAALAGVAAYGLAQDRSPATLNNVAFAALHVSVLAGGVRLALLRREQPTPAPREAPAPERKPVARRERRRPRLRPRPAFALLLVTVLAAGPVTFGLGGVPGLGSAAGGERAASEAAEEFLDRYLAEDGRVIRHDQGGDTVSEGQAYAMLLAVAIGDRGRFDLAWRWTRSNLARRDGLLSSRWQDGRVVDPNSATDADLDAAHALLLAAERFGARGYRRQGLRLARAVIENETVTIGGRPVLVAGVWARGRPAVVNPSYFAPRAYAELARASGQRRWIALHRSSDGILDELTARSPALPPDWADVDEGGARPAPAPDEARLLYGFEAVRVPVRLAWACDQGSRHLAARAWPFLRREARGEISSQYTLDGQPAGIGTHPAALVGAAASAGAAGEEEASADLLDRAAAADEAAPTYYGAAWVALGRVILTTDWLGDCPAGA